MRADGHKMIRSADHYVTLCPWHREKTPSCHVWDDHLKCFGCGKFLSAARYHSETGRHGPAPARPFRRAPEPKIDFDGMLKKARGARPIVDLSWDLGLDENCLRLLCPEWFSDLGAWAFPMRSWDGRVIGIRLRFEDGLKKAITGSHEGIFTPVPGRPGKRLVICEGPTDTSAALSLGFFAVGRPSCRGAALILVEFIRRGEFSDVVVVSDRDAPGISGAKAFMAMVNVPACVVTPPAKDLREFVRRGGTRQALDGLISCVRWQTKRTYE